MYIVLSNEPRRGKRNKTARMRAKLGLTDAPREQDRDLIDALLMLMAQDRVDYSIFWRRLSHWAREQRADDASVRDLFLDWAGFDAWLLSYSELLAQVSPGLAADLMLKTNSKYVLRNSA